jgi:hypothetical protein
MVLTLSVLTFWAIADKAYAVACFTGLFTLLIFFKLFVDTQRACHNLISSFREMESDVSAEAGEFLGVKLPEEEQNRVAHQWADPIKRDAFLN